MLKISFYIMIICIYYLFSIYIYIGYNLFKEKRVNKKLKNLDNTLGIFIANELNNFKNNGKIDNNILNKIKNKSLNKRYLCDFLTKELHKDKETVINFVRESQIFDTILMNKSESEYDIAYKIKYIGEFKIDGYYEYILKKCNDKSIYIQIDSLKALSKLGNVEYFIKGLIKVISSISVIHEKVLIDNINSFEGDIDKLNERLEEEVTKDNKEVSEVILKYFNENKYRKAKDLVLKLLEEDRLDKELKIACIKYLINIDDVNVKKKLILLSKDEEWQIRALSVVALGRYCDDKNVIKVLEEALRDENWYVRQNSAKSLYSLINNKEKILSLIYGNDKYASDAILNILSELDNLEGYLLDSSTDYDLSVKGLIKEVI